MIPVARTALMYAFLFGLVRLSGKRTLAEVTLFDFVTLLVMSEATQQALTGNDFSVTNAMIIVLCLVVFNRTMDWVATRSPRADRILNDEPTVLVTDGEYDPQRLKEAEVSKDEILEHGRLSQALKRFGDIRYAILERNGQISIIPWEPGGGGGGSEQPHPHSEAQGG